MKSLKTSKKEGWRKRQKDRGPPKKKRRTKRQEKEKKEKKEKEGKKERTEATERREEGRKEHAVQGYKDTKPHRCSSSSK